MTPEDHLSRIDAVAARPLLSNPDDRAEFYRRLIAQFTRQINRARKGLPTTYTPEQLRFLISSLESRYETARAERPL